MTPILTLTINLVNDLRPARDRRRTPPLRGVG